MSRVVAARAPARIEWQPVELHRIVSVYRASSFQLGVRDCATFFGDCVEAQRPVGDEARNPVRGALYDNAVGAMRQLRMRGCASMLEYARGLLVEMPRLRVQDGYFAVLVGVDYTSGNGLLCAPCLVLAGRLFGYNETGVHVYDLSLIKTAFKLR